VIAHFFVDVHPRSYTPRVSKGTTLALMVIATLSAARTAHATDRWTAPYAGVRHLHRRGSGVDFHVMIVDLRNPRVHFVSTPENATVPPVPVPSAESSARRGTPGYRWTRTSSFARVAGADIAVNANYFDIFHRQNSTCGLTVSDGHVWHSSYPDARLDCFDSIGFGRGGRAEIFDSSDRLFGPVPFSWMTEVVTGSPRLLRDGKIVQYDRPRHALQPNPRTAVGLSHDRRTMLIMVANGREGHAIGMTCPHVARVLHDLGAWDAINLDGGGSSTLYSRGEGGVVSIMSDGAERAVGNQLALVFRDPDPSIEPEPVRPNRSLSVVASVETSAQALRTWARPARGSVARLPAMPHSGRGRGLGTALGVLLVAIGAVGVRTKRDGRGA